MGETPEKTEDKKEEDKKEEDKKEEDGSNNEEKSEIEDKEEEEEELETEEESKEEEEEMKEVKIKPVLHIIHSDMMKEIFGDLEDNLKEIGIVGESVEYEEEKTKMCRAVRHWKLDGEIEEELNKPEVKEKKLTKKQLVILTGRRRRYRQNIIKDIQKYAASLVGGKTIPRDVIVAPVEKKEKKKSSWGGKKKFNKPNRE